jgi:Uma2 family endonuclease
MEGKPSMPATPRTDDRLTVDDFMRFPDDGKRHEIIAGVHYVTPSPNLRHQAISGRLHLALGNFLDAHPHLGRVFYAPLDVIFSFYDVVEPDLLVVAGDQLDILTEKNVQGAPAIVVEILSPSTRKVDEVTKRRLFERGGVREYWLIDPKRETVQIFQRDADGSFPRALELARADAAALTTPVLPGFSIELSILFAER